MPSSSESQEPVQRATEAARGLKPGTWESVEALAFLALAAKGSPDAMRFYESALDASRSLKAGTWPAVRALAVLAWVGDELASE